MAWGAPGWAETSGLLTIKSNDLPSMTLEVSGQGSHSAPSRPWSQRLSCSETWARASPPRLTREVLQALPSSPLPSPPPPALAVTGGAPRPGLSQAGGQVGSRSGFSPPPLSLSLLLSGRSISELVARASGAINSHVVKERKLCAHPRLEIYQQDQIYFVCPLARQGDFYVPEVKETERKGRGPVEASDAQADGAGADRTSEGSSVSLEVGPGSRETSAATLSPGVRSRGWDDSDNRSEHSYSESGASGSSFEELDLEGEGPLGEPRLSPEAEPPGTPKWARELSTPEKGEE
ncbi:testis expressed 264, ER-phagy receptor [Phyllostomus discolor]|uniref:Testis expressed 264, ER-phagy receptor n=1 Tax=Phyllostomus discolor TaxID=89673 RepID=A0A834E4V7_9CHIR|nr:testis expressed 264, ER-phagy receptor [Phyllostomus discolor]